MLDKIVVNIILFALYIYFFGYQSITRYFEKSVVITSHQEKHHDQKPKPPGSIFIALQF